MVRILNLVRLLVMIAAVGVASALHDSHRILFLPSL